MTIEIKKMIYDGFTVATVNILYYLPDHKSLVNEFIWSTLDLKPKYPRIKRFLDYWEFNIDGKIKKVEIFDSPPLNINEYRNIFVVDFTNQN